MTENAHPVRSRYKDHHKRESGGEEGGRGREGERGLEAMSRTRFVGKQGNPRYYAACNRCVVNASRRLRQFFIAFQLVQDFMPRSTSHRRISTARLRFTDAVQGGGGSSICEHSRKRSGCKEFGGSSNCEHGRQRLVCKECGGSSICKQIKETKHIQ